MLCLQCSKPIHPSKKFCDSSCAAKYNNARRVRPENSRKKTSSALKHFFAEHPEARQRKRQQQLGKTQSQTTRARISEGVRQYHMEHPLARKYTDEQRVYLNREAVARHKAKNLGLLPKNADIEAIKRFYLNTPSLKHSVDHIVPFAKGGQHTLSNLQYLTIEENCYIKNAN